jgi:hypothetical protein
LSKNKPIESGCQESRTFEVVVQPCGLLGADMARPPPRIGIARCPLQHLVPALIFFSLSSPYSSAMYSHLLCRFISLGFFCIAVRTDQSGSTSKNLAGSENSDAAESEFCRYRLSSTEIGRISKSRPGQIRRNPAKLLTLAGCLSDRAGVARHLIL